jgi:VanZ family protein
MVIKRQDEFKSRPLVYLVGYILLVVAAAVLLVPEAEIAPLSDALGDFRDAMHYPLFIAITILMLVLFGGSEGSESRRSRWIFVGVLLFAGVSELLQGLSDRSSSWSDFIRNLNGVLVGYYLVFCWRRRNKIVFSMLVVVAIAAVLVFAWAPLSVWRAKMAQSDSVPVLFDASQPLSRSLIEAKEGTGVVLRDRLLAPGEGWAEWDALEIQFGDNETALNGGIRLDGKDGSRATASFHCPEGESTVRVTKSDFDGDRDAVWQSPSDLLIHLGADGSYANFAIAEIRLVNSKE